MKLSSSILALALFLQGCVASKELPSPVVSQSQQLQQAILFRDSLARKELIHTTPQSKIRTLVTTIKKEHLYDTTSSLTITIPHDTPWALGIHLPQDRDTTLTKKYPLIVYLHGGVNTSRTEKGHDAFTMMSFLYDSIPCFVASPSGNRDARWWEPRGIERILFTVRLMTLYYPIDPNKIILAGVSDGGTATFALASLPQAPFSDYWAISGFPPLLQRLGVRLNIEQLKKRTFFMANGGNDRLYPASQTKAFVEQAQKIGIPLIFSFHPMAEHGFDYKNKEYETLVQRIQTPPTPQREKNTCPTTTEEFFQILAKTNTTLP